MSSLLTPLGAGMSSPPQLNSGTSDGSGNFDWNSEENIVKWKGNFVEPLKKILNQASSGFSCTSFLPKKLGLDPPKSSEQSQL